MLAPTVSSEFGFVALNGDRGLHIQATEAADLGKARDGRKRRRAFRELPGRDEAIEVDAHRLSHAVAKPVFDFRAGRRRTSR